MAGFSDRGALRELLERLHDRYNRPEFIPDDPATIAWGSRPTIVRNGHRLMRYMDDAPADFVRNASERELAGLGAFVHRTFNGGDARDFVLALRRIETLYGGIGAFFESRYAAVGDLPAVFADFRREFFAADHAPRCEKHLSSLRLPLDVHAGDMARALGLLSRRQNDWRAVEEVTAALRTFDADDPVRYDFSLFGAGIGGYLKD